MTILFKQRLAAYFVLLILILATGASASADESNGAPAIQQLLSFRASDAKFDLESLMNTLRDHRHEGWVLYAYADPTTHRPLIGAGFSLDLPARDHIQQDVFNPHPFLEPSSAELWQAAGLRPEELQRILEQFQDQPVIRVTRRSHRKIKEQIPQISEEDANRLLRVAVIQAIFNAKAYCRDFDSFTASQQMAMTQLVYQMGINLEEFNDFLSLINADPASSVLALGPAEFDVEHWKDAQSALIQSRWATLYRARAISVIAMLDPRYLDDPAAAEMRVNASLPPIVERPSRRRSRSQLRLASYRRHSGKARPGRLAHKPSTRKTA